jgi:outer membrane protein assembly factor BamA
MRLFRTRRGTLRALLVSALAASGTPSVRAEAPAEQSTLEAPDARIGEVVIRGSPVFDPDDPRENRLLYRLANRLHVPTRESAVRAQLLFGPGDQFEQRKIEETERNLRSLRFLREPRVRPTRYHDGVVDIEIQSHDVWTMSPGFSFGRSGGTNHTNFEFEDSNFLGLGKFVQAGIGSDVDRTSTIFEWRDPNVLGSRWRSGVRFADSTDGGGFELGITRPFYSLDTRWSAGVSALSDESVERRYSLGEIADGYERDQREANVFAGWSSGLENGRVHRWIAGLRYDSTRFAFSPLAPAPALLPDDRVLSYPYVRYETIRDGYAIGRNHDQIGRTEDLDFGTRYSAELGWSSPAFGANRSAAIFQAEASRGLRLEGERHLFFSTSLGGRLEGGQLRDTSLKANTRYFWRTSEDTLFYAGFQAEAGHALDADHDLLLGGDNGLRGYPLRYQAGNVRAMFTLEERLYTDWSPLNLFRVGGAVFVDVGRTWGPSAVNAPNLGLLKDIGVGLRLGSTRSALANVIHVDVAVPLDRDASVRGLQFLIETKKSF